MLSVSKHISQIEISDRSFQQLLIYEGLVE